MHSGRHGDSGKYSFLNNIGFLPSLAPSFSVGFSQEQRRTTDLECQTFMAVSKSRIAELASVIAQGTKALDDFYSSCGKSPPTFAADNSPTIDLPGDLERTRCHLVEASSELQALLRGPFGLINNYLEHVRYFRLCMQNQIAGTCELTSEISMPL